MPWLSVNHTRLRAVSAVPTPLLALEVHRAGMPGQPGAGFWRGMTSHPGPAQLRARGRISSSTPADKPSVLLERDRPEARIFDSGSALRIAILKPSFRNI